MVMCGDQNAGRSDNIKIDNSSFERVDQFRYLGTNIMNQNYIQEGNKCRLKSQNACYRSRQNVLSSSLFLFTFIFNFNFFLFSFFYFFI
jgi:hypothetical protein